VNAVLLSILVRWALLAVTVVLTAWILPGMSFEGGAVAALWVALLIAVVNVVVQQVMRMVPKPSAFVLLALLVLAVNGLVIWLVAQFTDSLDVDGLLWGVYAAAMISVISLVLNAVAQRVLASRVTTD
jgi:putative membrane protein